MYIPLLSTSSLPDDDENVRTKYLQTHPGVSFVSPCDYLRDKGRSLKAWWSVSTNPTYLASWSSRRNFAWCTMMGLSLLIAVWDILDTNWKSNTSSIHLSGTLCTSISYLSDATLMTATCLLGYLPTSSLWFDHGIAIVWASYYMCWQTLGPQCGYTAQLLDQFVFLALAAITGFHLSALLSFSLLLALCGACVGGYNNAVTVFFCFYCVFCGLIEHRCATLFSQLEGSKLAQEQLLENVTDGFCEVQLATGRVTHASQQLQRSFSDTALVGKSLFDMLCTTSDQTSLRTLLKEASLNHRLQPILVTCRATQLREFDAKVIPFSLSGDHIGICVQTLGEQRFFGGGHEHMNEKIKQCSSDINHLGLCVHAEPTVPEGMGGCENDVAIALDTKDKERSDIPQVAIRRDNPICSSASSDGPTEVLQSFNKYQPISTSLSYSQSSIDNSSLRSCSLLSPILETNVRPQSYICNVGTQTDDSFPGSDICYFCKHALRSGAGTRTSERRPPLLPRAPQTSEFSKNTISSNSRLSDSLLRSQRRGPVPVILNTRRRAFHEFKATPKTTLTLLVGDAMLKTNLHGKGCCYWHIAIMVMHRHTAEMLTSDCKSKFKPNHGWQCDMCFMLHDDESDDEQQQYCPFCSTQRSPFKTTEGEDSRASAISPPPID